MKPETDTDIGHLSQSIFSYFLRQGPWLASKGCPWLQVPNTRIIGTKLLLLIFF